MTKVLISGGGVAGLTLAYWLERSGHTPVIVERSPHGRLGGYGFDFAGTAFDVGERMGIIQELRRHRIPADSVAWVRANGEPFAKLESGLIEKVARGPYLGLMHYTLEDALIRAVEDRVEIRYEQSIETIHQRADAIDVGFVDGGRERFDLLVGADGVHSTTRTLGFGPERRYARHLGYHMACYPIPDRYGSEPIRAHYSEPGRQLIVYPTDNPGELIALFLFETPSSEAIPRSERLDLLRRTFGRMGWIAPQVLADAPDTGDIFMDSMTQIVMPTWRNGRVALIGDAAGCLTLVSGQGVSMAMAGGYILAAKLDESADPATAFARYEHRMRPEVERRQRTARTFSRALVPSSRFGVFAQRHLTGLLLRDAFAGLLRRQIDLTSILSRPDDLTSSIDER